MYPVFPVSFPGMEAERKCVFRVLYVVSAVDGLGLPPAVACFRLISCAVIMSFLFSLASGAQEILYVI